MRVRVVLNIDVDPDKWVDVYGGELDAVEEDVKSYAFNAVLGSAGIEESDATVTLER